MPKAKTATAERSEDPELIARNLVSRLYDDILAEGCVIFVGAGSTTERKGGSRKLFYDRIKAISEYTESSLPSFPELMQFFCERLDGGRHNRLIREALSRIESFCARGEQNRDATMFTDPLAEIPYFNRFVTTNWDPFLERSLDVLVPMVEDRDLAFWDDGKRQVLKIHGCITRPYSIVATQSDYDACVSGNPLIFNKLRDLMATKTFVFAGYSLRDPDFQELWEAMIRSLGHFSKLAYALDPNATSEQISYWKDRGIHLVQVSDILFIRALRTRLEKEDLIPSEQFLRFLEAQTQRVSVLHFRLKQTWDGGLASAMYQDGLMHVLEDVLVATKLGSKKKEDFEADLREAERVLATMRRKRDPIEISYWSGRLEVIKRFVNRTGTPIPAYFHPYKARPTKKLVKGRQLRLLLKALT
jgi:SIR2-like protein